MALVQAAAVWAVDGSLVSGLEGSDPKGVVPIATVITSGNQVARVRSRRRSRTTEALGAGPVKCFDFELNRHPLPLALASNAIVGACVSKTSRNALGEKSLPLGRIDWPWDSTSDSRSSMNADIILVCVKKLQPSTDRGAATLRAVAIHRTSRKACAVQSQHE